MRIELDDLYTKKLRRDIERRKENVKGSIVLLIFFSCVLWIFITSIISSQYLTMDTLRSGGKLLWNNRYLVFAILPCWMIGWSISTRHHLKKEAKIKEEALQCYIKEN
ncbi:MAG: hypothetical protein WCV41_04490, partial [Patescibacteria group bacterium]